MDELKRFYERLERLDWYYEYADDHRAWEAGHYAYSGIRAEAMSDPVKEKMFKDYSEHAYSGPAFKTGTEQKPKPKLEDYYG